MQVHGIVFLENTVYPGESSLKSACKPGGFRVYYVKYFYNST